MNSYKDYYELELIIYRRPNLRSYSVEMESYMGRDVLDNCFEHFKIDRDRKEIFMSFPERWLNIIEQHALYDRLHVYYPNLKKVQIKTHSVYLVQCTYSNDCKIVDASDLKEVPEKNIKLYNDSMVGDIFKEGELTTLHATS